MAAATDSFLGIGDDTGIVQAPASAPPRQSGRVKRAARRAAKRAAKKERSMQRGGVGVAPWIVTIIMAAVAGFGGYYLFESLQSKKHEVAEAKAEVATLMQRVGEAESRAMSASAELGRTEEALSGLKQRVEEKAAAADELAAKLESIVGKDQGQLVRDQDGTLTLQLMDKVLFKLGEAELTDRGKAVLAKVGEALQNVPDKQVWVQGHTDDVPISKDNDRFLSNWQLSSARALNVVTFLQDEVNVDPRRLAAVAFGEYRPVSRKKAKNRRIEIVLAPKDVRLLRD